MVKFEPNRRLGFETSKLYNDRIARGFWETFVAGDAILDIGYRGGTPDALPLTDTAIGIELDYKGYDGFHLPFPDESQDSVHASHILEHVQPTTAYLREWFRVLRPWGTLLLFVPHAHLYERRLTVPPSRWSGEHMRSFTPATLLAAIEDALPPNSYRIRHLADRDNGYDYNLPPTVHPTGALEIECVVEKITPPAWNVEP